MARRLISKPICAEEERNGTPSADQGLSTAKAMLFAHQPTSPCPTLPVGAEPKSKGLMFDSLIVTQLEMSVNLLCLLESWFVVSF